MFAICLQLCYGDVMAKGETMNNDYICELCKEPQFATGILFVDVPQTGQQQLCNDCFARLGVDGWLSVMIGIAGRIKHNAFMTGRW